MEPKGIYVMVIYNTINFFFGTYIGCLGGKTGFQSTFTPKISLPKIINPQLVRFTSAW